MLGGGGGGGGGGNPACSKGFRPVSKERFLNVDFLRFVGAVAIVFFHLAVLKSGLCFPFLKEIPLYNQLKINAGDAFTWVDFFFIISGFFLFYTTDFRMKFVDFFKKKIIRLLPLIWFAIGLYMVLSWFGLLKYDKYINVFTMLLLNNVGFTSKNSMGNIHPVWFISAMFWVMMFYFYLKNLVSEKWFNFLNVLFIFFGYTYIINSNVRVDKVCEYFINIGILRALAGIGTGYLIYLLYAEFKKNCNYKNSLLKTLGYTAAEIYLLFFVVQNTMFHKIHFNNRLILIIAFIPLFWLFLIKRGYISKLLNNKISSILGSYSYAIFVMHIISQDLLRRNFWNLHKDFVIAHPLLNLIGGISLAILLGIAAHYLIEVPAGKYLKQKFFPNKVTS